MRTDACFHGGVRRAAIAAVASLVAVAVPCLPTVAQDSDEDFVRELMGDAPIDRSRLARFFFGVSASLDSGRSAVKLLEVTVSVRDPNRQETQRLIRERYDEYARTLERFRTSTANLMERPTSPRILYRVLLDGHRTCWLLDRQIRFAGSFGATGADLRSALSSGAACATFRAAAFQPRVETMVEDVLANDTDLARENRRLREEIRELERLFEDLRDIDEQE